MVVLEKGDLVGGTSAWSGGALWVPVNPKAAEAGLDDSREDALAYIASLSNGMIDPAMAEVFVDTGAEMVAYLEANTPMALELVPGFPDYQPEQPGGKAKGGTVTAGRPVPLRRAGGVAAAGDGGASAGRQRIRGQHGAVGDATGPHRS